MVSKLHIRIYKHHIVQQDTWLWSVCHLYPVFIVHWNKIHVCYWNKVHAGLLDRSSGWHLKLITKCSSQDTPHFLEGRAYLGRGQCCRERVVTYGHGLLRVVHVHLKRKRKKKELLSHWYGFWHLDAWMSHYFFHFSPLHVQMLQLLLQQVRLVRTFWRKQLHLQRKKCKYEGSQGAGGWTLDF